MALEILKPYNPNNEFNEGKVVNHKPIFVGDYPNEKAKPGSKTPSNFLVQDFFFNQKGYNSYKDAKNAVKRGESALSRSLLPVDFTSIETIPFSENIIV